MFANWMTSLTGWMAYRLGGLILQLGFMSSTTGLLTIYDMLSLGWKLFAFGCGVNVFVRYSKCLKWPVATSLPKLFKILSKK